MLMNMNEHLKMTLPYSIAAFLRLNYVPRDYIAEMMRTNKYAAFQGDGTFTLLRRIVATKLQSLDLVVDKLWDRLGETHEKAYSSKYFQILRLVRDY